MPSQVNMVEGVFALGRARVSKMKFFWLRSSSAAACDRFSRPRCPKPDSAMKLSERRCNDRPEPAVEGSALYGETRQAQASGACEWV